MLKIGPYTIKPLILAPMAGVSQMPFRRIALNCGAGLAPTELISAKGLYFANARTKSYLLHDQKLEQPFCVQLFGGEEQAMAEAAIRAVEMGAKIIDINMGCPVKKVTKTHAGSALLCDIKRAVHIVQSMLKATLYKIPITAKIRSGWDETQLNFVGVAKALEDAGIAALAIHARTRAQGYQGKANWRHIAELKSALNIPVIGNGDVLSLKDAERMMKETSCDAVMIGRAALGNPWVFSEIPPTKEERLRLVHQHLNEHVELNRLLNEGKPFLEAQALKSFRTHLMWYSKGFCGGAHFRREITSIECLQKIRDLIDNFFKNAEDGQANLSNAALIF
jgi:tRNA-dihydrouridine synthase B